MAMSSRCALQFLMHSVRNVPAAVRPVCRLQSAGSGVCSVSLLTFSNISALKRPLSIKEFSTVVMHSSLQQTERDVKEDFSSITNGDPMREKKLKVFILEVEYLRQNGSRVPDKMKLEHWKSLLELETRSKRKKYLSYLFAVEKKKENAKKKKDIRREKREEHLVALKSEIVDDGKIRYGLGHNSIFMRIYDATIIEYHNNKLIQAMMYGQKLVVDCGYDNFMTVREAQNCAKQLMMMFADNRLHPDPFNLYFCNVSCNSVVMKTLEKFIPTLYQSTFPLNITEKSYLEIFDKEKLVYLTPHCKNDLKSFDDDAVYIVGAMVDKVNNEPLSLAKAKRDNLKMAKLPLDQYLLWGSGASKSLTLDQVIKIMLDIRQTGDWNQALKHVPRRKITDPKNELSQYSNILNRKEHIFR